MTAGRLVLIALAALMAAGSAQAQDNAAKPDWMTYKNPYADAAGALASPHRNAEEISAWAQQAATDTLTFTPADYRARLGTFKQYFSAQGWQLYAEFLKTNVLPAVTQDGLSVGAIADGAPEIVSSEAVDNAWHWVVKTPLTVSFSRPDAEGKPRTERAVKYLLTMDMERVGGGDGQTIVVNNWRMDAPAAQ